VTRIQTAYDRAIILAKTDDKGFWLDIGCFFGTDCRKPIYDGWPANRVIGTDLRQDFLDLGKTFFREKPGAPAPSFIAGDIFDRSFLDMDAVLARDYPRAETLVTLTPLVGKVRVIHVSAFFHLFDEHNQAELTTRLAKILSEMPESIIIGSHVGAVEKGVHKTSLGEDVAVFFHSPASFKQVWYDAFQGGEDKIEAVVEQTTLPQESVPAPPLQWMKWYVRRRT